MRKLTHYELSVLIKDTVNLMHMNFDSCTVYYQKERAKEILKYVAEYEALEPMDD